MMAKRGQADRFNFGRWLKDQIALSGVSAKAFASRIEVDESTLHGWFRQAAPNIRRYVLPRIARELRMSVSAVEYQLESARRGASVQEAQHHFEQGARFAAAVHRTASDLDPNVHPYGMQKVPLVPTFDLAVAAGSWTDVSDVAEVCDPRMIDHGLFRVRIRGDSMRPKYSDGDLIEFRCLREDRDGIVVGKDYYVQRSDGMATFKRVESVDEDSITLRALNRRKYGGALVVPRQMAVRVAIALAKVVILD